MTLSSQKNNFLAKRATGSPPKLIGTFVPLGVHLFGHW